MTALPLNCFFVHRCTAIGAGQTFQPLERIGGEGRQRDPETARRKLSRQGADPWTGLTKEATYEPATWTRHLTSGAERQERSSPCAATERASSMPGAGMMGLKVSQPDRQRSGRMQLFVSTRRYCHDAIALTPDKYEELVYSIPV